MRFPWCLGYFRLLVATHNIAKRLQDQTRRLCDIDVNNIDWMGTKKKTQISYFNKTDKGKQFDCNIWKGFRNI